MLAKIIQITFDKTFEVRRVTIKKETLLAFSFEGRK
jgi:hypothetical protein